MATPAADALLTLVDLGAERAVLGNALLEAVAVPLVADVPAAVFHKDSHRALSDAIRRVAATGTPVEPGTVRAELERMGRWDGVGHATLAALEEEATVATSLPSYIAKLRELAARRELVRISRDAGHAALDLSRPIDALLASHVAACATLEQQGTPAGILEPMAVAHEMRTLTELDRIATGLRVYDAEEGLTVGDLHVLAARTRMGKTSAGLQIAHHVATVLGLPVLFLSLEMSRRQIFLRLRGLDTAEAMESSGFHIADPVGVTAPEVASIVRRASAQYAVQLVIVDHLQQITADPSKRWERRDLEIRDVCTRLADAARGLNVAILALAQINREGAKANAAKPSLEHLQDGGAIEQTAASVTMLYTDPPGTEDSDAVEIAVTFAQRKNRHGHPALWRAKFLRPHRFEAA